MFFLTFALTLNFVDRQIVNILAEPIREELQLADWQIGLMSGLAFALLYSVAGIPLARWADRGNRPKIMAFSVLVWRSDEPTSELHSLMRISYAVFFFQKITQLHNQH